MRPIVHITPKSGNAKTGPIPVTTSNADTCPKTCPFKGSGCYAESGPLAIHWRKVSAGNRGGDWNTLCEFVSGLPAGQIWRHNQAGDLPHYRGKLNARMIGELAAANAGKRGFTYTHHKPTGYNLGVIRAANATGFTINLSADNLAHADTLADTAAGPVVVVLPSDQTTNTLTPAGRRVVVCPAAIRDGITCESCKLCARPNRTAIVGFPAHGSHKAKIDKVIIQ